jgi:hypothetical protein
MFGFYKNSRHPGESRDPFVIILDPMTKSLRAEQWVPVFAGMTVERVQIEEATA